jgi:hypothetical protein
MMLALVVVAGSAWAQTARSPYAGNAYTYAWAGVTCNTHSFSVTTSSTDPDTDTEAPSGTTYQITTAATSEIRTSEVASIGITWASDLATQTRYVWLKVTSADNCTNYKYVQVEIKAPLDFIIADITTTYTAGEWKTALASDVSSCPSDPVNPNTDAYDAGTTTLYFRITRTTGGSTPVETDDDWQFNLAVSDDNGSAYAGYTTVVTDGVGNTITPTGSTYAISAVTGYALVAITVSNEFENAAAYTATAFTADISSASSAGNNEVAPQTTNLNSADHSLKSTPSIGSFQ